LAENEDTPPGSRSARGREQYGECNTLLPELAATEVVKCAGMLVLGLGLDVSLRTA